jgi:type IV secretion system protein VirD4
MNATGKGPQPGPAAGVLSGCQDYPTAARTAEEMIHRHRAAGSDAPSPEVTFWDSATAQALACYLHAAALSGLPASSVTAWLAGPAHSATAAQILATHPGASRQAAATLRGLLDPRPSKTAETIRHMAAAVFAHATGNRPG